MVKSSMHKYPLAISLSHIPEPIWPNALIPIPKTKAKIKVTTHFCAPPIYKKPITIIKMYDFKALYNQ
jgi:hypothetical protein